MTAEILGSHLERFAGGGRDGLVFPNTAATRWPSRASTCTTSKGTGGLRPQAALPRSPPYQPWRWHSPGSAPQGDPGADGTFVDRCHADRYGHLLPSLDAEIADEFDRQMQAAKANRDRKVIHANFGDDAAVAQAPRRKKLG